MKNKLLTSLSLICSLTFLAGCNKTSTPSVKKAKEECIINFAFDNNNGEMTKNEASGKNYKVRYVFNQSNADNIFKAPSDPIYREGVTGNSLYLDGHSTKIVVDDVSMPRNKITVSSWIAPRGFENLNNYDDEFARAHPRLSSIFNKGDLEMGEGFCFGYGRLGMWGIQMALHNSNTNEDVLVGFYDPINSLELYKWNYISASFDGSTGYICLSYNGEVAYEALIPDLENTSIISSLEPLYMGAYINPITEFKCDRQLPAGIIDEAKIFNYARSPKEVKDEYLSKCVDGEHPDLAFTNVQEDRAQYEGDRYRTIYHGLPSAVWMNEPHAPIYYKGMYHLFYQHNPIGPYWSQIRWGHLASTDMIHWVSVKDAVAPIKGVCPEGVWTGGSVIGPDGTPWLIITAGTNQSQWSGQNVAYAHCVDPNDPYLTDWVVEDAVVITQPRDDSQGERDQFRDPFCWYDDGWYYMMVSTSIPGAGGSANIYRSRDMKNWEYKGYLYECPLDLYPEQGAHWECVILLPITSEDGKIQKYILFDCPQYTVDGYVVDCYYWIGQFDKNSCRFIPDNDKPQLFDLGRGIYTGQTGMCYRTEEEIAQGKSYTEGRTVIFSLEQGKAAGTEQNIQAGWAHSLAMPVELKLTNDGNGVIRRPIKEIENAYGETLFNYHDTGISYDDMNTLISNVSGDSVRIDADIEVTTTNDNNYQAGLYVRYNKNVSSPETERTGLTFCKNAVSGNADAFFIDRTKSTATYGVEKNDSYYYYTSGSSFEGKKVFSYKLTVLLDRSSLEVYLNDIITFTTRIYPRWGDSNFFHFFADNAELTVKSMKVINMKSVYFEQTTPSYYGNTGNLGD